MSNHTEEEENSFLIELRAAMALDKIDWSFDSLLKDKKPFVAPTKDFPDRWVKFLNGESLEVGA